MAELLDQNSSALNQEILSPDQQVRAGRILPQQQKTSTEKNNPNDSEKAPNGQRLETAGQAAQTIGKGAEMAGKGTQKGGKQMEDIGQSKQKVMGRVLNKLRETDSSKSKPSAAQSAVKSIIGFSYAIWLTAFILAGSYDLYNIVTMEAGSEFDWIADLILGGGLTILLWTQGSKARQAKKVVEQIISMLFEIIPGVGLLPLWTITVIWQFYKTYNEHEMEQLEKEKQKSQGQATEEYA